MNKRKKYFKITGYTLLACILMLALWVGSTFIEFHESVPANRINLENTDEDYVNFIKEDDYSAEMTNTVVPTIEKSKKTGTFKSSDNKELYYESYITKNAKATVVISHGFTECSQHYQEVIYYFLQRGYSVFIMDHRGHGYSYRNVEDLSKVHVTDFNDYITDFETFVFDVVAKNSGDEPKLLYAHSMGGGIGTGFLERNPDYFKAAVLSTPMLDVATGGVPQKLSHAIATLCDFVGNGSEYILGFGPYNDSYNFATTSAGSEPRYEYYYNMVKADTSLQTASGTFSWLKEAINVTKELTDKDNVSKIKTPILMFEAGNDTLVRSNGYYRFMKYANDATFIYVPNSKHTLFKQENEGLIPYFNQIMKYFDQYDK